jgi:hypothetical protein
MVIVPATARHVSGTIESSDRPCTSETEVELTLRLCEDVRLDGEGGGRAREVEGRRPRSETQCRVSDAHDKCLRRIQVRPSIRTMASTADGAQRDPDSAAATSVGTADGPIARRTSIRPAASAASRPLLSWRMTRNRSAMAGTAGSPILASASPPADMWPCGPGVSRPASSSRGMASCGVCCK